MLTVITTLDVVNQGDVACHHGVRELARSSGHTCPIKNGRLYPARYRYSVETDMREQVLRPLPMKRTCRRGRYTTISTTRPPFSTHRSEERRVGKECASPR